MSRRSGTVLFVASVLIVSGCSTTTKLSAPHATSQDTSAKCVVDIYPDRQQRPSRAFQVITLAESHIQRNFFFGGNAKLDDDAYQELRAQACAVGANAVLIDDVIQSKSGEFSHIHLWASLVRYTQE